jgi:sporulation protein YhbH
MSISQSDWSLHRKGPKDQARHQEKVREAIKGQLGEIISNESIITSDGKKIVKVPVRSLEEYSFRYDPFKKDGVGQGPGGSKPGDVIGQVPQQQPGRGRQAGNQPGIDYYETEFTIDELAEMIFADLGLPNLKDKGQQEIISEKLRFTDVRQTGILPNLDKKRSMLQAMKRQQLNRRLSDTTDEQMAGGGSAAKEDDKDVHDDADPEEASGSSFHLRLRKDDLRYRTWDMVPQLQHNAVVIAMRDVSGSMGDFEKYISRAFYFWMVRFLRSKYSSVQIVFITHHTEAKEVDEQTFFSLGESGGTRVSSAYQLCSEIIDRRYPPDRWNIYPFHFSDGDNWGDEDNARCVKLVRQIVERCNLFGYGEIKEEVYSRWATSSLMSALSEVKSPAFVGITIKSKEDVYPALRRFFSGTAESQMKG